MKVVNLRKKKYKVTKPKPVVEYEDTEEIGVKVLKPIDDRTFAQTIVATENVYHRIWVRPRFIVYEIYTKKPIAIVGFLIVWVPWSGEQESYRIQDRPYQSMWRDMEIVTDKLEKENNKTIAR